MISREYWRIPLAGLGILLLLSVVVGMALVASKPAAGASETPSQTSWVGNTFGGANNVHVQQNCLNAWIAPDGRVICNAAWDESGTEGGVYKNGQQIGRLQDTHFDGEGGYAVTGDDSYIYAGATFPSDSEGIKRFQLADYTAASFPGGMSHTNNWRPTQGGGRAQGMAVTNGSLFVSIPAQNTVEVYQTSDMAFQRIFSVTAPGRIAADNSGRLWIASSGHVVAYSTAGAPLGPQITDTVDPTALGIDQLGRLLVGDDGPNRQQVLVYDISGTPKQVEAVGVAGGEFSPPAGRIGPLRFNGILGVGTDSGGTLYVAQGQQTSEQAGKGTNIEAYSRSGSTWVRRWQVLGLEWVDMADADLASLKGSVLDVYTATEHFTVDLSKAAGQQWTWVGDLRNRFAYPNDPRVIPTRTGDGDLAQAAEPRVVYLQGQKFLAITGPYGSFMRFYKFVSGTENTVLATEIATDAQSFVDSNGDLWSTHQGGRTGIVKRPFLGLDANDNPRYGAGQDQGQPVPFNEVGRLRYDAGNDTMFIMGFTVAHPTWENMDKVGGTMLARYDNWSRGNRNPAWATVLPFNTSGTVRSDNGIGMVAMDIAGNRIYTVMLNRQNGENSPRTYSYDQATGQQLAWWLPDTNVRSGGGFAGPGLVGWVDIQDGIAARPLPNGQTLILQEDDAQAKVLMYVIGNSSASSATPTTTPTLAAGTRLQSPRTRHT